MTAPVLGVCSQWVTEDELGCATDEVADAIVTDAIAAASAVLHNLSGNVFPGTCSDVIRPCPGRNARDYRGHDGRRVSLCSCRSYAECGCSSVSQVRLRAPVAAIAEVLIDGAVLDPSSYRVDDWRWLVRTDGEAWPCCQDIEADSDQEGTFEVSYSFGTPPPVAGKRAAASLACELILAWTPGSDGDCRLPERVRTITRQGVTMTLLENPRELFEDGFTGLEEVDLWLGSLRHAARNRPMRFLSPDVRPRRFRRPGT